MIAIMLLAFVFYSIFSRVACPYSILVAQLVIAGGVLAGFLMDLHLSKKRQLKEIDDLEKKPAPNRDGQIYQILQEDLRSFKTQQWNVIYYQMLVLGALFALGTYTAGGNDYRTWLLSAFALASVVYGVYLIVEFQYNLRNTRVGMARTESYKSQISAANLEHYSSLDRCFWRDKRITVGFFITAAVGLGIVLTQVWLALWKTR